VLPLRVPIGADWLLLLVLVLLLRLRLLLALVLGVGVLDRLVGRDVSLGIKLLWNRTREGLLLRNRWLNRLLATTDIVRMQAATRSHDRVERLEVTVRRLSREFEPTLLCEGLHFEAIDEELDCVPLEEHRLLERRTERLHDRFVAVRKHRK
jgi:hypothetical protein